MFINSFFFFIAIIIYLLCGRTHIFSSARWRGSMHAVTCRVMQMQIRFGRDFNAVE